MMDRGPFAKDEAARITELYRAAAEWGDAWGQNNFGYNLRDGIGIAKDPVRAVRWFRLAAAQDNDAAAFSLGDAYETGHGIAPDQAQAANLYRYASHLGNTGAMVRLAIMVREGRGVEKDLEYWRSLLLRAAEIGNSDAMWRLGMVYVYGNGVAIDRTAGIEWLRKSAQKENLQGSLNLGVALLHSDSEKDKIEGVEWLRKAVLAGDNNGMDALGYAYENGLGVAQNYAEAAAWYRKSETAGNSSGTNNLARLKFVGLGEPKDAVQARALFEKASAQGASEATCNLATMLLSGDGGAEDAKRGYVLMQQAAAAGEGLCQLKLGIEYRYGNVSFDTDMGKAKDYLKRAQEQHLDEASAQLAEIAMYQHEDDDQQIRSAFAELTRLADANGMRAQFLLGEACILGRPWPRDPVCARRRFQQAAEQGFGVAASSLGLLLESGLGGPVDLDSAEVWFRKAIEMGAMQSHYELGRLLLRKGHAVEGIQNLLAVATNDSYLAAYLVTRYCAEHADCGVSTAQRATLAKKVKEIPEGKKNDVAWGLATDTLSDAEDGHYAVQLMESMSEEHRAEWGRMDTLAAAYARAGEFDLAVKTQQQAIAFAPADMLQYTRRTLNERLALYQSKKSCDFPY